jgi:hypothetical protein
MARRSGRGAPGGPRFRTRALAAWDGALDVDANAWATWPRSVARTARAMAEEQSAPEAEGDPWTCILCAAAQPAIDAWRARHGDAVESQHHPPVPEWEIEACTTLYDEAMPDRASTNRDGIEPAYHECLTTSGQEGREVLYRLRKAEEALVAAEGEG